MNILIATTNPAKYDELKRFFADLPYEFVSLRDIGITDYVEETGASFEKNAVLKATTYARISGIPAIADDGGFEIDALGGEPGVKSHRWIYGDRENTDDELIQYTIEKLKGLRRSARGAQLRLVLAFALPDGRVVTKEASVRGIVAEHPSKRPTRGFPYRSLLFLPEIGKYYDHMVMTTEETDTYNHRKRAAELIKPEITSLLTNLIIRIQ